MSYVYYNPNPLKLSVGDCTIRAISRALNYSWKHTYLSLAIQGFLMYDMPSANRVWGEFLKSQNFIKRQIPDTCPDCYTIRDFCIDNSIGTFIVGTGEHVVCGAVDDPTAVPAPTINVVNSNLVITRIA